MRRAHRLGGGAGAPDSGDPVLPYVRYLLADSHAAPGSRKHEHSRLFSSDATRVRAAISRWRQLHTSSRSWTWRRRRADDRFVHCLGVAVRAGSIGRCSNLVLRVGVEGATDAERLLGKGTLSLRICPLGVEGDSRPGPEPVIFSDLSRMLGDSVRRSQVCPVKIRGCYWLNRSKRAAIPC